jgi:hypothetical protein
MDRDRARVRSEDRRRRGDTVELAPQRRLDGDVLEYRFDDQVGVLRRTDVVGGADAGERLVARLGCEATLVHGPAEVGGDALASGLGPRKLRLVEDDVLADRGMDLGDAVAHEAGPSHEDPLDRHGPRVPAVMVAPSDGRWSRRQIAGGRARGTSLVPSGGGADSLGAPTGR